MLERITPVILTFNEAPNIGRSLAHLEWAHDVVVVDSHSTDETPALLAGFPNVRMVQRPFRDHGDQWRFAIEDTGVSSDWILRLDADYLVPPSLVEEMAALAPGEGVGGYRIGFRYCMYGRPLRASLYPPNVVLFRRGWAEPRQDGHTERWHVRGRILPLKAHISHDDRKPLAGWLQAQGRYMALERDKLLAGSTTPRWRDRVRRVGVLAPFLVLFHCLFIKGLVLDGRAGVAYAFQRATAEMILSLLMLEHALGARDEQP